MAIASAICNSFKVEILKAVHNFTAGGANVFNLALYTSSASMGAGTTAYATTNEIANTSGSSYSAKGKALTSVTPVLNSTTYISNYFPQGILYATLVEAFGYLKGPMDMLTYYENKYKTSIQQFAGMQIGRRRRDDYTDGTVRIQVKSPSP